jgi:hypothetical protein
MREAVSLISSYRLQQLPASLMQRLELMQHLALAAYGQPPPRQMAQRGVSRGARIVVLAWFSFGVLASGAMGAGAIVGLRTLAAGAPPVVGAPAVASWSHPRADWDTVHLVIDRSQRTRVPLALQVTGMDDGAFDIVMHGLPAGVRPSRGAPIGEATWVLRPTDLDGLYLTLDSTVPDAFDAKIAVLTSPGVVTAGSIVQVRLVEMAPATHAAVTVGRAASPSSLAHVGMSDGPGADDAARTAPTSTPAPAPRTVTPRSGDKAGGQPTQRRTGPVVAGTAASSGRPVGSAGRTWPEGAYGLGAAPREPEQETSWWQQMPPPSWSPFLVGQERP